MNVKIGLEIHCQITPLKSKLFCFCSSDYRDKESNSNICSICMGLPGSLPLLNRDALKYAIMVVLALNCNIPKSITFYRKNYFYPDLPKNFQITQYNAYGISSIGFNGSIKIDEREIRIRRIQLEEDPGRIVYELNSAYIDYNRSGIPLLEIVTEPDFNDPRIVRMFLNKLSNILAHIGIDPELKGAVRCDANISIDEGNRVEIKNVNSFKDVEKALLFEISRQKSLIMKGIEIKAETRHWDDARKVTIQSRTKEEEEDYRYFPEADIPIIEIEEEMVREIKNSMPEMPDEKLDRFVNELNLSHNIASILIDNKRLADMFEDALKIHNNAREIANWIVSDLKGYEERLGSIEKVSGKHIAEMVKMLDDNIINRQMAKMILAEMVKRGDMPSIIIKELDVESVNDKALMSIIDKVFEEDRKAVEDALKNEKTINFLVGKVMKYTKGKSDASLIIEMIKEKLNTIKYI